MCACTCLSSKLIWINRSSRGKREVKGARRNKNRDQRNMPSGEKRSFSVATDSSSMVDALESKCIVVQWRTIFLTLSYS